MKKIIAALMFLFGAISLTISTSAQTYYPSLPSTYYYPSTANCVVLTRDMGIGSYDYQTNGEVTKLQQALTQLGYFSQTPTGYYGNVTYSAVRNFQSANNISSTGYVGPLTRSAIQNQTCATTTPTQTICPLNTNTTSATCVCPTGYTKTQIVYIQAGPDMWTCTPNPTTPVQNPTPVISSVSGPTVVYVNQSNTWSIGASVADNSNLTYSITWGDENMNGYYYGYSTTNTVSQQTSTFTHVYNTVGTYTITIKVTSSNGQVAQTTRTVEVRSGTGTPTIPGQTICPINTTFTDTSCVCPTGYTRVANNSGYGAPTTYGGYTYYPIGGYGYGTATTYSCTPNGGGTTPTVAPTPVISSVSGPTTVVRGQSNTWIVNASVADNSNLTYSIKWGDEGQASGGYYYVPINPNLTFVQTSTFTHVYNNAGTYTMTITVKSGNGKQTETTKLITVTNSATPGQTVCPLNTTLNDASSCTCPANYGKLSFIDASGNNRYQCLPRQGAICPVNVTITIGNFVAGDVVNYCTCPTGYTFQVTNPGNPMLPDAGTTGKCVLGGTTTPVQNPTPVISSVSGPTVVYVNQSNTWSIGASVVDNSNLTYNIKWGDEYVCNWGYCYHNTTSSANAVQTSTFTHAYSTPGTYTITIDVISSNGRSAQTTRTVEVRSGTNNTSPVCPLNTVLGYSIGNLSSQYQGCVCPTGYSQQMTGYPCPPGMYCPAVMVVMCMVGSGN